MDGDVTAIHRPDLIHVDDQIALETVPVSYLTTLKYFSEVARSWFQTSFHVGLHLTNCRHACLHAAPDALFLMSSTSAVGWEHGSGWLAPT